MELLQPLAWEQRKDQEDDPVMEWAVESGHQELRILAATLFCLAAQQGVDDASEALSRMLDFEASLCESEDEFLSSPVLRVIQVATTDE